MCGRYTQAADLKVLGDRFHAEVVAVEFRPRYNLAPAQEAPVVYRLGPGRPKLDLMRWGWTPAWPGQDAGSRLLINARAETLAQKATFRKALEARRCLVLADGFYEWSSRDRPRIPWRYVMNSGEPFAMAGLWQREESADGQFAASFLIITTAANGLVQPVHHRMPVILGRDSESAWLDPARKPEAALAMLKPLPEDEMNGYTVSTRINSAQADSAELILPISGAARRTGR